MLPQMMSMMESLRMQVIVSTAAKSKGADKEVAEEEEDQGAVVPIEEIVVGAPEEVQEASSAGSELNSELDVSDFDEPESENVLYAELCDLKRSKNRWSLKLKSGVMRINGVECLFSSGQGVFDVDCGSTTAGDGGGPEAAALEDDDAALADDDNDDDDDAAAGIVATAAGPSSSVRSRGANEVAGQDAAMVHGMLPSRGLSRRQA